VETIPHINDLAQNLDPDKYIFLWIAADTPSVTEAYIAKVPLTGTVGADANQEIFGSFGIEQLPTTVVVDRAGIVRLVEHPLRISRNLLETVYKGQYLGSSSEQLREDNLPIFHAMIRESSSSDRSIGYSPNGLDLRGQTISELVEFGFQVSRARILLEDGLPSYRYDVKIQLPKNNQESIENALTLAIESAFETKVIISDKPRDVYLLEIEGFDASVLPARSHGLGLTSAGITGDGGFSKLCMYLEYDLGIPVVDETNLPGIYNFELNWKRGEEESLRQALMDVGLKLVSERRNVSIISVTAR
jgi:uncharacterized protein (TIGR03435 family)